MKRVIKQLISRRNVNRYDELVALCDDGTVWLLEHGTWKQLPGIPASS